MPTKLRGGSKEYVNSKDLKKRLGKHKRMGKTGQGREPVKISGDTVVKITGLSSEAITWVMAMWSQRESEAEKGPHPAPQSEVDLKRLVTSSLQCVL